MIFAEGFCSRLFEERYNYYVILLRIRPQTDESLSWNTGGNSYQHFFSLHQSKINENKQKVVTCWNNIRMEMKKSMSSLSLLFNPFWNMCHTGVQLRSWKDKGNQSHELSVILDIEL